MIQAMEPLIPIEVGTALIACSIVTVAGALALLSMFLLREFQDRPLTVGSGRTWDDEFDARAIDAFIRTLTPADFAAADRLVQSLTAEDLAQAEQLAQRPATG
jgi:hypothetical protein